MRKDSGYTPKPKKCPYCGCAPGTEHSCHLATSTNAKNVTRYVYSFSFWPDETWNIDKAVFDLFATISRRVEMEFTQDEFEAFRSSLSHRGLTLREVTRVPHHEPENVP